MTEELRQWNVQRARCQKCGHDLEVRVTDQVRTNGKIRGRSDGYVYCSNRRCTHFGKPHPTKGKLNNKGAAA